MGDCQLGSPIISASWLKVLSPAYENPWEQSELTLSIIKK